METKNDVEIKFAYFAHCYWTANHKLWETSNEERNEIAITMRKLNKALDFSFVRKECRAKHRKTCSYQIYHEAKRNIIV